MCPRGEMKRLEMLIEVARTPRRRESAEQLLVEAAALGGRLLGAGAVTVRLVEGEALVVGASWGEIEELPAGARIPLVMPVMSGRMLAEQVQRIHPETKVLYMSGYTDDAIVRHNGLDPETSLLQKPFTPTELARRVREMLDAAARRRD